MEERQIRELIGQVKAGSLSRRGFVQMMVGVGLTAPLAAQMLAAAGVAQAQSKLAYKPTKRGGGGALKVLWWQGATLLNPHFATGTKDQDGSRIFYEPLASWDPDGNMAAILAAEIPTEQRMFATVTPCFVATAAYGTPLASEISSLRRLRDRHMANNVLGRAFVSAYGSVGPKLAGIIRQHEGLRAASRALLAPAVALARLLDD